MFVRILQGATIPAADAAWALLMERIEAIGAAGHLAMEAQAAADLAWASVHAASTLYVVAKGRQPDPTVIDTLRERALQCIYTPDESSSET
jgi:hypothetical protein